MSEIEKQRLRAKLEELKALGLHIDEKRGVASLKLMGSFSFTAAPENNQELSFDEDEEYFYPTFRALSAAIIPDRAIDFSEGNVLKKSVKKLKGQTVYKDHNLSVNDWVGVVAKTTWDESKDIPPGINANLKINKKWNERIVDGIKDRAIHSVSVTVLFDYKKSHPDLEDFWYHIGEEIGGEIVRMIATKIISFGEISLVWQGADVYAKRIDLSHSVKGMGPGTDYRKDNLNRNGGKNVKLTRTFATLFMLNLAAYGLSAGKDDVELDDAGQAMLMADMSKAFSSLSNEKEKLAEMLAGIFGNDVSTDQFESKLAEMSARAEIGNKYLDDARQDALKFAKIVEGKTDDKKFGETALGKSILNAGIDDAIAFRDEFRKKSEEKFPQTCTSCGAKLTRGSAHRTDESDNEADVKHSDYSFE